MAEVKEVKMGRRNMAAMGQRPKIDNLGEISARLFKRILSRYWLHVILVLICIGINAYVNIVFQLYTKELIDVYIVPYIGVQDPDFSSSDIDPVLHMEIILYDLHALFVGKLSGIQTQVIIVGTFPILSGVVAVICPTVLIHVGDMLFYRSLLSHDQRAGKGWAC